MSDYAIDPALVAGNHKPLAGYQATHFQWQVTDGVATITLNRPEPEEHIIPFADKIAIVFKMSAALILTSRAMLSTV